MNVQSTVNNMQCSTDVYGVGVGVGIGGDTGVGRYRYRLPIPRAGLTLQGLINVILSRHKRV